MERSDGKMSVENLKRLCFVLAEILKVPGITAAEIEAIWKKYDAGLKLLEKDEDR